MKKAAFIVYEYNEDYFFGGGEKVNSYIIRELLNRKYIVDVYANISYVQESKIANVNIFIKDKNFEENYEYILTGYNLVLSTNCEYKSDITYSHNHSYAYETTILISKMHLIMKKLFSRHYKRRMKKYKNACNAVLGINKVTVSSNIIKSDYIKFFNIPAHKIYIMPPGVDIKEKEIKVPDKNSVIFGLVARGFIVKGGFVTLFAVNKLKRVYKNFKVRIINQNAKKNLAIQFIIKIFNIEKYIEFLPLQKDMTNFYKSIDFLIVPSLKEPFGLVAEEGMSFSKIVLVSSKAGAADLIKDGWNGFIIDYSNPKQKAYNLYKCMKKALELENNHYIKIACRAYETVKNKSWEEFAKKYIDLAEEKKIVKNPKISVIIPVYNSEAYISDCINSIVNQSLYETEIICVNESSTDNTFSILKKHANFDGRIKIFTKENSGSASAARNLGLKHASGKYIYFIDDDDFISSDYLETMYNCAEVNNADIVINDNINSFCNNNLKTQKKYIKNKYPAGIYKNSPEFTAAGGQNSLCWSKLYKTELLKKTGITFPEGLIYEDEYFYYTLMPFCSKIAQCNCGMYYYRQHKNSITGNKNKFNKYQIFDIFRMIYGFYEEHNLLKNYKLPYSKLKYRNSQIADYKKYRNEFLKIIKDLNISSKEINNNQNLKLLAISPNKFLYRINSFINIFYKLSYKPELSNEYTMLYETD